MRIDSKIYSGSLDWIGVREKAGEIKSIDHALAIEGRGLEGDKITLKSSKKRQVTLMQKEHISVILSLSREKDENKINKIQYYFKRNLLISNYNIQSLKGKYFSIGAALFFGTGDCKPCKKIENSLGINIFNAMQGMGGITATVVKTGNIKINDRLNLEVSS